MQNPKGSTTSWVVGIVVVVLVLLGIWWYASMTPAGQSGLSTTTAQTATTTNTTGTPTATEVRSSSSVASIVSSLSNGTRFGALLTSTGVSASITGRGPYTVFVPTDAAFSDVTSGTIANMSAAELKRLVQYHIVSGKQLDIDAVSSGTYTALSKDPINFRADLVYKEAFVNSGYAINEYKASNGIVYLISNVLIPPQTAGTTTGSTGTPHP